VRHSHSAAETLVPGVKKNSQPTTRIETAHQARRGGRQKSKARRGDDRSIAGAMVAAGAA
jgi:hypothetical protein